MLAHKLEQFKHEGASWLRSLDFLQQENIMLKNRLAEVMKHDIDRHMLESAEHYQNIFLDKDAVFALLRQDIKEIDKILSSRNFDGNGHDRKLVKKQGRLRLDMEKMEKEFSRIKAEFNNYFAEAL